MSKDQIFKKRALKGFESFGIKTIKVGKTIISISHETDAEALKRSRDLLKEYQSKNDIINIKICKRNIRTFTKKIKNAHS